MAARLLTEQGTDCPAATETGVDPRTPQCVEEQQRGPRGHVVLKHALNRGRRHLVEGSV